MDSFEYLIAIIAIILGLGMTHLLSGLGKTIYRLTGHGKPLKLSWAHFLWVLNVLFWMISYWWYSFSHHNTETWTFGAYLIMLPFPIVLYLQSVILYPHQYEDVLDLDEYFLATRHWFFALMFVATAADWIIIFKEPTATLAYIDQLGASIIIAVTYTLVVAIVGSIVRDIRLHIAMPLIGLVIGIWQMFVDHPILGGITF